MNKNKFSELVGIILGDGHIGVYKRYRCFKISLNSRDDKEYLDYIKNLLKGLFNLDPIIKFRKNENTVDIFIFKKRIIYFLIDELGLVKSPKWNRARIPEHFLKNKLALKVLKGFFDTDGCVVITNNNGTRYPQLEIKVCPSPMQQQFINIIKKNGFNLKVYHLDKGKVRMRLNGKKQLKRWLNLVGFNNQKHLQKANSFF